MKIRRWGGNLVITLPMYDEPRRSRTGKSMVIACSCGTRKFKQRFNGCNILCTASAFYYPVARVRAGTRRPKKRRDKRAMAPVRLRRSQQR
jgi:hypothetical protein